MAELEQRPLHYFDITAAMTAASPLFLIHLIAGGPLVSAATCCCGELTFIKRLTNIVPTQTSHLKRKNMYVLHVF